MEGLRLRTLNNFISGLVILFERPVKAGDRIEVGAVEGKVVSIGARATTVVTNDNIAIDHPIPVSSRRMSSTGVTPTRRFGSRSASA
jgi:hypothetical protein